VDFAGALRCSSDSHPSHPWLVDLWFVALHFFWVICPACMALGEGRLAADGNRVVDLNYLSHLAARLLM